MTKTLFYYQFMFNRKFIFKYILLQVGLLSALVTLVLPSPSPNPSPEPSPAADPDLPFSPIQDPEDPDFSGVVDFSNAKPGPDGSWCITKVVNLSLSRSNCF